MADSTTRVAEAIQGIIQLGPDAARPGIRSVALPADLLPTRVPPAAPQAGDRFARTAGGRGLRVTEVRPGREQGRRIPAHRPHRVPGRG
ncbi:hypothetical protein HS041_01360 [Planomonospora sp. ID67723]|uniref:hypothetical protein n=1 Tax=Planomonospora sp. ID67723 TaxID=2738134 RepID=UPI0018C3F8D4|nr:hypothetical protein [Planomonospora sp. ID67723]MBG0826430.1 hypothetical protein [Planomonospora sp. ID67723]